MSEPTTRRVSHERAAVESLRRALEGVGGIDVFSGQDGRNRFGVSGWEQTLNQQFQFGDLRVETPTTTVVVEVESAGTVTNLVKYWPLLATGEIEKRFVFIHVFQLGSVGDYIAHRRFWGFLVERMREDLEGRGIAYPELWEAYLITYPRGQEPVEAAELLRTTAVEAAATRGADGP